jgi:hypothetical protein
MVDSKTAVLNAIVMIAFIRKLRAEGAPLGAAVIVSSNPGMQPSGAAHSRPRPTSKLQV